MKLIKRFLIPFLIALLQAIFFLGNFFKWLPETHVLMRNFWTTIMATLFSFFATLGIIIYKEKNQREDEKFACRYYLYMLLAVGAILFYYYRFTHYTSPYRGLVSHMVSAGCSLIGGINLFNIGLNFLHPQQAVARISGCLFGMRYLLAGLLSAMLAVFCAAMLVGAGAFVKEMFSVTGERSTTKSDRTL